MLPVNLSEDVPPKVSSPLMDVFVVVGWKDTETDCPVMVPCVDENVSAKSLDFSWPILPEISGCPSL